MIKRTIEISREPAHLSVRLDQLVIQPFDRDKDAATSIPCEDIGIVLVDHPQVTYSHHALATLGRYGATVVFCGRDHLPVSVLNPLPQHTQVVHRLHDQINASKPLRKRLWQQVVKAKIAAQADAIAHNPTINRRLRTMARDVKSGDPSNLEAQAAKAYWHHWREHVEGFQGRDTDGNDPVNAMLNYGYAVLRAAIARALVAAGLQPALGIHHANRANAFCLADDLIEPVRPMIDRRVLDIVGRGLRELDQPVKAHMLDVLTESTAVDSNAGSGPLMVNLHRYAASLADCFAGERKALLIPAASKKRCQD